VIGHGRSIARAIYNALKAARDAVQNGVLETMRAVGKEVPARGQSAGEAAAGDNSGED
jgi:fatty acid/phospholipid biosynthesis enzyme